MNNSVYDIMKLGEKRLTSSPN